MTIRPDVFESQIVYLRRHHEILNLSEAVRRLARADKLRRPVAVITFDDAYRSVFDIAFPIMQKAGVPGCCFVATDLIDSDRRFQHDIDLIPDTEARLMSWDQLARLAGEGWDIGSHSASHTRLSRCDSATVREELQRSRAAILQHLGIETSLIAYPFGGPHDLGEASRSMMAEVGYVACCSNHGGENRPGVSLLRLSRIDIGGPHPRYAWKAWVHGIFVGQVRSERKPEAR
jgi:peptidoglycan/xylan/chitin deacetylase (PgdA/CDA1 family)